MVLPRLKTIMYIALVGAGAMNVFLGSGSLLLSSRILIRDLAQQAEMLQYPERDSGSAAGSAATGSTSSTATSSTPTTCSTWSGPW